MASLELLIVGACIAIQRTCPIDAQDAMRASFADAALDRIHLHHIGHRVNVMSS